MKRLSFVRWSVLAVAASGLLAAGPALADPPSWHGRGNDQYDQDHGHGHEREHNERRGHHFDDHGRAAVRAYFADQYRHGRCPPGLARVRNACVAPAYERRWAVGRPLPGSVTAYALPSRLVVQIGAPPMGYRYVRVANDILLVAAGTNLVVDAINDLGR